MAEIYSLKITGVYDDGTGRLVPGEMPFMLAPGCCLCGAVVLEAPCEFCGQPYCAHCLPCWGLTMIAMTGALARYNMVMGIQSDQSVAVRVSIT